MRHISLHPFTTIVSPFGEFFGYSCCDHGIYSKEFPRLVIDIF